MDQVGSYLSKDTLKGRCPQEKLLGHTPDISKFRFAWFQPVWYYSPTLSFPQDRMEPGFFLKMADNTGDSFAYEILPGKTYEDIPLRRNPTVLVRCVVRERDYGADKAPLYTEKKHNLGIFNSEGKEIPLPEFDREEGTVSSSQIKDVNLPVVPSRGGKTDRVKSSKPKPQSSSKLFDLDTNLKDFISHPELDEKGNVAIDAQMANKHLLQPLQEEPLSYQTEVGAEEEGRIPDSDVDDDLIEDEEEAGLNSISADLNNQFDNEEESELDPTMDKVTSYKYISGILYLKVLFSNGITSWISVDKVKNVNPKIVADYVMVTDLGEVSNKIERRWARAFLRSLRRTTRRLRRVDFQGFNSSTSEFTSRRISLDRTVRARRGESKASKKKKNKSSRS